MASTSSPALESRAKRRLCRSCLDHRRVVRAGGDLPAAAELDDGEGVAARGRTPSCSSCDGGLAVPWPSASGKIFFRRASGQRASVANSSASSPLHASRPRASPSSAARRRHAASSAFGSRLGAADPDGPQRLGLQELQAAPLDQFEDGDEGDHDLHLDGVAAEQLLEATPVRRRRCAPRSATSSRRRCTARARRWCTRLACMRSKIPARAESRSNMPILSSRLERRLARRRGSASAAGGSGGAPPRGAAGPRPPP